MSARTKIKLKKIEPFFRIFRNIIGLIIILATSKPNNLKAISKLHLQSLEMEKLKVNSRNLITNCFSADKYVNFNFKDEQSIYSQHGEDGITLKIINVIGLHSGFYVELGAGGYSSNTQILAHLGWSGLCIDGSSHDLNVTKNYFKTRSLPTQNTKFLNSWITVNNINNLLHINCCNEIDVLSIDLDGIDYWLLATMQVTPKIIIAEYNASFGPDLSVTIPYTDDFYRWDNKFSKNGWYYGASLQAITAVLKLKGYELVYCEESGVNSFFVRNDIIKAYNFTIGSVKELYKPDHTRKNQATLKDQISHLQQWELVSVSCD